jgi:hypothetical protein
LRERLCERGREGWRVSSCKERRDEDRCVFGAFPISFFPMLVRVCVFVGVGVTLRVCKMRSKRQHTSGVWAYGKGRGGGVMS